MLKSSGATVLAVFLLVTCARFAGTGAALTASDPRSVCVTCHQKKTPGLVNQWRKSRHGSGESVVDCHECHQAEKGDPNGLEHKGNLISVIASPEVCAVCHPDEAEQFAASRHAASQELLTGPAAIWVTNHVLGATVSVFPAGASPAAVSGCEQCHGSVVRLDKGAPDASTWPNSGIGRVNPDRSKGSCSACHSSHEFSVAQARQPESCGRCHDGSPAHDVTSAYRTSLHGMSYDTNKEDMNLGEQDWLAGKDYSAAPTCATCHMSGIVGSEQPTHDVGQRLGDHGKAMKQACLACHSDSFSERFFTQYEAVRELLARKWTDPVKNLYCRAVDVLQASDGGKDYQVFMHGLDHTYLTFTQEASQTLRGASKISALQVDSSLWELARAWRNGLVPQLRAVIEKGEKSPVPSTGPDPRELAAELDREVQKAIDGEPVEPYESKWQRKLDLFGCNDLQESRGTAWGAAGAARRRARPPI